LPTIPAVEDDRLTPDAAVGAAAVRQQPPGDGPAVAHDPDPALDAAVEIATDRTREAQQELAVRLAETRAVETEARVVEQRARDLRDLAIDAAADDDAEGTQRPT